MYTALGEDTIERLFLLSNCLQAMPLCSMPLPYPLLPDKIDNLYSNEEIAGFSDHHAALFRHSSEQLEDLTAKNDAALACPLPELDDFDKRTGPEILIDKTGVADQNVSSPL